MTQSVQIRCYDYVNRPFAEVRTLLLEKPNELFGQATHAASGRASAVAAGLHVQVGGIEIGKEIEITVLDVQTSETDRDKRIAMTLEWKATRSPGLFPVMNGVLDAYPITATETQLDFQGNYTPPLGLMGRAIDAMVGHRIAEASVHSFVSEVAAFLRK